jgi:hypothetical protein
MTRPNLRIVISNGNTQTSRNTYSNSATPLSNEPIVTTLDELYQQIEELLVLKPSYVGGIAVLVRDQLERQRIEHPTAARQYADSLREKDGTT